MLIASAAAGADTELERTGGPYVPTPTIVVDQMLRMGSVGPQDYVLDLGSGDGVIVLTAAQQYKARGMGVDIDPMLVKLSNANAKRLGIDDRVSFEVQDVFKTDLSKASVITLYLLPSMMSNLKGKVFLEAKPGTRVVSHDYVFGDWPPDNHITLDVPEKEKINGTPRATIYLWIVPAKVAGTWQVQVEGAQPVELAFKQSFQSVDARANAKNVRAVYTGLRGKDINFTLMDGSARRHFNGTVDGEVMHGIVDLGGGKTAKWTARKS